MTKCAFTIVSDSYYYAVGTHLFINSFKYFNPDIPLVVFRQNTIDKVMVNGVNFFNAKPTFAKLLTDKYNLVCNIDADTLITAPLDAVWAGDYDIAVPTNFNDYENRTLDNVTAQMYLQAGLVASPNKEFWDKWEEENKYASMYVCKENDVLNKLVYDHPEWTLKILDKYSNYYGCKSLNREAEFYLEGKKVMCRGEQVFAYHWARGQLPKLQWDLLPFPYEVKKYFDYIGNYGQSVTIL